VGKTSTSITEKITFLNSFPLKVFNMTDSVPIDEYSKDITRFYGVPGANAGKKNGMYKHGRWGLKTRIKKKKCSNCGATKNLIYHHINGDELDNKSKNIRILCRTCHERHHERGYNLQGKKAPNASKRIAPNGKRPRKVK
jgi:hypothetical protein